MSGSGHRDVVVEYWDAVVRDWLSGRSPHRVRPELRRWFSAYVGSGRGAVTGDASPEPYIGPLASKHGMPRLVALGLNPGEADLAFQGPSGVFALEYQRLGGFSDWAVTEPYLREPWRSAHRRNRYHENLRTFARRWLQDPDVRSREVLVLELYPWHSDAVTSTISPDPRLIEEFVWRPLTEIDVTEVFAFGAPWYRVAQGLRLRELPTTIALNVPARRVKVFALPSGQRLVVGWQPGYNGPPGAPDVAALRAALRDRA